ncbi:Peptide-N4-(N-acetyl-beta-glucosaminyl)asparagine amidase A [Sesamum angolense]|uniref:Peptide-N4-(N-acetyl-beta-glucosaminyl)asparagine amidase A n=1 Tax=Sesamum angolense TaxID=2727404 RepID=A0AAE1W238_9LAMI|nr:Peptide-N4-(N-acetyl-beta-glucosaminyl)asparagine amidase A [Sesamum angolense]
MDPSTTASLPYGFPRQLLRTSNPASLRRRCVYGMFRRTSLDTLSLLRQSNLTLSCYAPERRHTRRLHRFTAVNRLFFTNSIPAHDTYFESNGLPKTGSNGAYREVLVKLDDDIIGSVVPFPVIFGGGINPLFWEPVASIGAFDLPSYEFDLTPFLGLLLDGGKVQAGAIKFENPSSCLERESNFRQLDGEFEIQAKKGTNSRGGCTHPPGISPPPCSLN